MPFSNKVPNKPKTDPDKPYSEIQSVTSSNIYRKMTPSVKLQEYTLSEKAYFDEYGINRPTKERDDHIKKLDTCKATLDQLAVIKREKPELLSKIDSQEIKDILTVNGIRFSFEDGSWGLIRASSNKPSLVVVTESPSSEERKKKIFDFIDGLLQKTGKIGEYDQKI